MASTALSTPPKAVMSSTGTSGSIRLTPSRTSSPSTFFMRRSVTTTSAGSFWKSATATAPLSATVASYPAASRSMATVSAMSTTSSTTSTRTLRMRHRPPVRDRGPKDGHRRARAGRAREVDLAGVVAHDAGGDREAEARPLAALLRREEGIEDGVHVRGGDAAALVDDRERDLVLAGGARLDEHGASRLRRVAGVEEEVDE